MQVDYVRHDRGAENAGGEQHALGAGELRGEETGQYPVALGLGVEHLQSEGDDYHPDHRGDHRLQRPKTPPLQGEYRESAHRRDQARWEKRYSKSRFRASAAPMNSARSVAIAITSACTQSPKETGFGNRSRQISGRFLPAAIPSLADIDCMSIAIRFEQRITHKSR